MNIAPVPTQTVSPVSCTMEAKICPDGTAVGRIGPNCEFALCPGVSTETPLPTVISTNTDITLGLGQTGSVGGIIVKFNSLVQDSRCPVDVYCIQAGTVKISADLVNGTYRETKILSLSDSPYSFLGYQVSITSVNPVRQSGKEILVNQYKVTFHVVSGPKVSTEGQRCGGNMTNAPVCAAGLQCIPEPGSHLPFGDVGGMCVKEGILKGVVTLSPTCPVESIPPNPACAPKPYVTSVEAQSVSDPRIVRTSESASDGSFVLALPYGDYTIQATSGNVYPRCAPVTVSIKTATMNPISISCDTGIR